MRTELCMFTGLRVYKVGVYEAVDLYRVGVCTIHAYKTMDLYIFMDVYNYCVQT